MNAYTQLAAKKVKDSIRRHDGPCALFVLPSGKHLICLTEGQAYKQAVQSYRECWIGTYDIETPQSYIAEDLSA